LRPVLALNCLLQNYKKKNNIKKTETGDACGTYGTRTGYNIPVVKYHRKVHIWRHKLTWKVKPLVNQILRICT
jgi:hypothetical protein